MRVQSQRKESLQFIPGRMHQQDALLDQAGEWLVQCRTTNHFDAGMAALLSVTASGMATLHASPPFSTVTAAQCRLLRRQESSAEGRFRHHPCVPH